LRDKDPMLRRTAVLALRMLLGGEVDGLIVGALSDADSSVRNGAIAALGSRPFTPALVGAVSAVVKNDEDPSMRSQAIALLGRRQAQFPETAALLEWAKNNDPSEDVRKAAATALQSKLASGKSRP
jgi:HEAT repeat protein